MRRERACVRGESKGQRDIARTRLSSPSVQAVIRLRPKIDRSLPQQEWEKAALNVVP